MLIQLQINYHKSYTNIQSLKYKLFMDYDARKDSLLSQQESEKVQIYLSLGSISFGSAFVVVYLQQMNKPKIRKMTTKTSNAFSQKIDFPEIVTIQYFFEIRQKLIMQIYNGQSKQLVGVVQATVGEIFNGRNKGIAKDIKFQGSQSGIMFLRCQKVERGSNKYVQFQLSGRNIDVGTAFLCFGEGGCHWKMYKIKNNEQYLLYESETKEGKNNLFNSCKINQKRLCNNNPQQPIIFKFFSDSGSTLIGQTKTNLQNLSKGILKYTITKNNSERGVIILQKFKQIVKYDFTDYLSSGMQMAMVVCVDFTASNGIQNQPTSLHFTTNAKKSQYEEALHQVCNIVLDYDTDKLVPVFGFGAKVNLPNFNSMGKVHHCFPVNGSQTNPNLYQNQGIRQGYRAALPYLSFSGPTYFAPLLRQAMNVCKNMKGQLKQYMILLILTDGIIHDKQQVKDLLVKCGRLPLSVIIIGIGNNEDWGIMHQLDDDDCQMTDFQGNKTERDLVQFVQFSAHNNNGVELARQVLFQLPRQVEQYHELCKLTPEVYKHNLLSDVIYQKNNNPYSQ